MKIIRRIKWNHLFLACVLLTLLACTCASAEGEPPALKKILPDQDTVSLYADAAEPAVVMLTADPEGAVIGEFECTCNPQGIISVRPAGENRVEILPLKAGKATLTVKAGRVNAAVKVAVLQPVTAITLSCGQLASKGRTLHFNAEIEPKNAADKTLEWSVKAKNTSISIDQQGNLTIPEHIAPGTEITVRCRALGTGGEVAAEQILLSQVKLPDGFEEAVSFMKQYPMPEALQNLSTEGRDWIPEDLIPELTGIQEVTLEENELYITTEKDVANIYIGESSKSGNTWYQDYNSQGDPQIHTKHEARLTLQNPKSHLITVSVNEYVTIRGKKQLASSIYTLKTNPVRLEAESMSNYIDLKPTDYPPYTKKLARYCDLQYDIYPDGRPLRAEYHFDGDKCSFQLGGRFDPQAGKLKECSTFHWYFDGETDVVARVKVDQEGKLYQVDFQIPSCFGYTFTNRKQDQDVRRLVQTWYSGLNLDAENIEVWSIEILENFSTGWETKYFVCDEPLFVRQEDGSLLLNAGVKGIRGAVFPCAYLSEIMDPALFSMPRGLE